MEKLWDGIVIGGGAAGLTAALYLARGGASTLLLEQGQIGGQIALTEEVVNYPGVPTTTGWELTRTMQAQAEGFGAEIRRGRVTEVSLAGAEKTVTTAEATYRCRGIILATGCHPKPVGFSGEREFLGRGVSNCATCDGAFFKDREVFVVGGGYAAAEESVYLTQFARHVTVLMRKPDFSCPPKVACKANNHEKITVLGSTVVESVWGDDHVTGIRYRNTITGAVTEQAGEPIGVFVFGGYAPATEFLSLPLDDGGYVLTDDALGTGVPGVFAAGDVRAKELRQVVTATADGALAAKGLEKYLKSQN